MVSQIWHHRPSLADGLEMLTLGKPPPSPPAQTLSLVFEQRLDNADDIGDENVDDVDENYISHDGNTDL